MYVLLSSGIFFLFRQIYHESANVTRYYGYNFSLQNHWSFFPFFKMNLYPT